MPRQIPLFQIAFKSLGRKKKKKSSKSLRESKFNAYICGVQTNIANHLNLYIRFKDLKLKVMDINNIMSALEAKHPG